MLASPSLSGNDAIREAETVRRPFRSVALLCTLPIVLALATACQSLEPAEYDGFFFPRQLEGAGAMDALHIGELDLAGDCLVVSDSFEEMPVVLVWPSDYDYEVVDGSINVLDGIGHKVMRVGDEVVLGGGQIRLLDGVPGSISPEVRHALKERCPGIYWFVGSEARLATADDMRWN